MIKLTSSAQSAMGSAVACLESDPQEVIPEVVQLDGMSMRRHVAKDSTICA